MLCAIDLIGVSELSDGITEGRNPAGDEFSEEGLAESALRHRALGADDMLAAMLEDIEGFNAGVYEDDAR